MEIAKKKKKSFLMRTQTLGLPGFSLKREHAAEPVIYLNEKQARKGGFFSSLLLSLQRNDSQG